MEAVAQLSPLFNLYFLPVGRMLFSIRAVVTVVERRGETDLAQRASSVLRASKAVLDLDGKRVQARHVTIKVETKDLDTSLDRAVGALHRTLKGWEEGAESGTPEAKAAAAILAQVFPAGLEPLTVGRYVEEVELVDQGVEALEGPLRHHVEVLHVGPQVLRMKKASQALREALNQVPPTAVTYDQVRAAHRQAFEQMLSLVACVLGKFPDGSPEHVAARTEILAPILRQNAAVGEYLRYRRPVRDVEPETGTESTEVSDTPSLDAGNV